MDDNALVVQAQLNAAYRAEEAASKQDLPSFLFRPRLSIDGDQWCALYGENLQDGVAGFGKSPADAFHDFDRAWSATLAPHPEDAPKKSNPTTSEAEGYHGEGEFDLHYDPRCLRCTAQRDRLMPEAGMDVIHASTDDDGRCPHGYFRSGAGSCPMCSA